MNSSIYFFLFVLLALNANGQNDFSIIHVYRLNSLKEVKGSEFEVAFNDQPAFLLSSGGRISYKLYSQGKLKISSELKSIFKQKCATNPVYFDVVAGEVYYLRIDGVSCINLVRSGYDGGRDLEKEYDFKFPVISKEEDINQPFLQIVKKEEMKETQPSIAAITSTSGLSSAAYENKYALVIGNSAYKDSPLRNPANDANAFALELKKLNFQVLVYTNLDKSKMKEAIRDFESKIINNKGVAIFYFAGHGLQSNGSNWLVPVDAKIEREYDIEDACIKADVVLRMLEINENPMNIVILDACRNNPFASIKRSLGGGLGQPENAPKGSIIAFATAPGKTASDGDGSNGLYTQELIKAMRIPGLSVEQVFKEVRVNVINLSKSSQTPWENSSLLGDFYFHK